MNVPPNNATATPFLKRRRASDWLRKNDPDHKKKRNLAKLKRKRDAKQAKANPALVNEYRRLMLRS